MITGGQLVAYLVSMAFSGVPQGWRWMMGLSGLPALIQLIGLPFLPESPRFLFRHGKKEQARVVLGKILGSSDPEGVRATIELNAIDNSLKETSGASYRDLLRQENRRPLIIACGLQALQQLSGFNTAMYYSATILKMAGFRDPKNAINFSLLIAGTNMLMTLVALKIIDRLGRRSILLYTVMGMVLGLVLLGFSFFMLTGLTVYQEQCQGYGANCGACLSDDRCGFVDGSCFPKTSLGLLSSEESCPQSKEGGWFALGSLVLYVAMFALGLGNVPWLIQSEVFGPRVCGKAGGVATSVNWVGNLVVSITFLSLTRAITSAGTFWLYAGISLMGWVFILLMVPETKGKSLEEIQALFRRQEKKEES